MRQFKTLQKNLTENDFQIFLDVRETLLRTGYKKASKDVKILEKFESLIDIGDYLYYLLWRTKTDKEHLEMLMDTTDKKLHERLIALNGPVDEEEYKQVEYYMHELYGCIMYIQDESDAIEEPICVGKVEL